MDRLDLELYADRVTRHAERLADDVAAARLRLAWSAFERDARLRLRPEDRIRLEAVGVLDAASSDTDDRALIERRAQQLQAVAQLQRIVEEALVAARRRQEQP